MRNDPPSAFFTFTEKAAVAVLLAIPAAFDSSSAYPYFACQCMELIVPWRHVARKDCRRRSRRWRSCLSIPPLLVRGKNRTTIQSLPCLLLW